MAKLKMLTEDQWFKLNTQFERTPAPGDTFAASGEHYILMALLNSFGLHPNSSGEALDMAEELLSQGWENGS